MSDPLDIINRIENAIYYTEDTNVNDLLRDAVDEIERLRAALHIIAGDLHTSWQGDIARAALEGRT